MKHRGLLIILVLGVLFTTSFWLWTQYSVREFQKEIAGDDILFPRVENDVEVPKEVIPSPPEENEEITDEILSRRLEDIIIDWPKNADWPVNWKTLYDLPAEEYVKLSQATKDAVDRAYYTEMGLIPPPDAYHHHLNRETGMWELVPNNVLRFEVKQGQSLYNQFHQLADAEYERYTALKRIATNQESVADYIASGGHPDQILVYPPEVCELAREWYEELHEKTYGPTLIVTSSVYYDRPRTEADEENEWRLRKEALDAATPKPKRNLRNIDVVESEILDEIEVALGITIDRESEAAKISRRIIEQHLLRYNQESE